MIHTLTDRVSVAANAVSTNRLAAKLNEFLTRPSIVKFYLVAAAIGLNATVQVGNQVYIDDQEISGANRFPTKDQDLITVATGGAGTGYPQVSKHDWRRHRRRCPRRDYPGCVAAGTCEMGGKFPGIPFSKPGCDPCGRPTRIPVLMPGIPGTASESSSLRRSPDDRRKVLDRMPDRIHPQDGSARFSRRSKWLSKIFPPSQTAGGPQPGFVSGAVQLTQTYADGVAYTDENQFITLAAVSNPGPGLIAAVLPTVPDDEFHRVIGISAVASTAPTAGTQLQLFVRYEASTTFQFTINDLINFAAGSSGVHFVLPMDRSPQGIIIPPGHRLRLRQEAAGDAAADFSVTWYVMRLIVPIGGTIYF